MVKGRYLTHGSLPPTTVNFCGFVKNSTDIIKNVSYQFKLKAHLCVYFYVFILNYTGLIIHLQPICNPVLDNFKEFSVGKKRTQVHWSGLKRNYLIRNIAKHKISLG